jgi:hypothetical protein
MEEITSLNMQVQRLKEAILLLDLPCSGPVRDSGKILTTGKSHRKKPDSGNRRKGPDFRRVFLMLKYTEKPQNTYIQS